MGRAEDEAEYIRQRDAYEQACFNYTLEDGEYPVAPVIFPALGYRIASRFDDKYYYSCAFETWKKCLEYTDRNDGTKGWLRRPIVPHKLAGKPIKKPGRPKLYAWTIELGFTTAQTAAIMKAAIDSGLDPSEVIRASIDETLVRAQP
jgi:hypothetical protein